jgi:anti-sigma regulatory factor (Ser/Thr protein kinase)
MVEPHPGGRAGEWRPSRVDLLDREFDVRSLAALRHEVASCAERNGLSGDLLYRFVVAVNEIATNAVQHGHGGGRLELWRTGDQIFCRVTDRGPGIPRGYHQITGPPPPSAINGRGLWLARQGSRSLTIHSDAKGTSITLTG